MLVIMYLLTGAILGIIFVEFVARDNFRIQEKYGAYLILWILLWPISLGVMIHGFVYTAIKLLRERKK